MVAKSSYFYRWPGGWVGGLSETGNKAISALIEIEVELSWDEAELGNKGLCQIYCHIFISSQMPLIGLSFLIYLKFFPCWVGSNSNLILSVPAVQYISQTEERWENTIIPEFPCYPGILAKQWQVSAPITNLAILAKLELTAVMIVGYESYTNLVSARTIVEHVQINIFCRQWTIGIKQLP